MITIAICTRDRSYFLAKCLQSIAEQWHAKYDIALLVVNNASTDNTDEIVIKYSEIIPVSTIYCSDVGLSAARNAAMNEASSTWITYLDDDCIIGKNFLSILTSTASDNDYDCFGGPYIPKHLEDAPKWLPNDFGSMVPPLDKEGRLYEPKLSGGNFTIKLSILKKTGGFNSNYGMKGTKTGYGEETMVQRHLLLKGNILGFIPSLYIEHYVLPHKYKISWHMNSICQRGKLYREIHHTDVVANLTAFIRSLIACLFIKIPRCSLKFLFQKNYYRQNFVIDTFGPVLFSWCRMWR